LQLQRELADVKNTISSLRNSNSEKDSRVRTLEVSLLIHQEDYTNIHNLQETRINKLTQKEELIQRQVEMIDSLSLELKNERKENEFNKNKLSVCQIQLNDINKSNKELLIDKNFYIEKFNSVDKM